MNIDNLQVIYNSNLLPSLKGIYFDIKSGHRVLFVRRTVSGKSTLVQALFRVLEAEEVQISVGEIDISNLWL